MAVTPGKPETDPVRRRRLIIIAIAAAALLIAVGFVAAYLFFFGSEAPAAPSIENAIKVLLPSAPPE